MAILVAIILFAFGLLVWRASEMMKNLKAELDSVLAKREEIENQIQKIVDQETDPWGIKITNVKIKDIELPENMKRAMAHQAEAERDRRARVINAEAEKQASQKLKEAGDIISKSPSAMKLRFIRH
ncbi:MAG: SPFH domain-containing protein [Nanoarchaeota archaeon]|nr:SPFH domain-containing protein [Nanoarchaeota archaeon]